MPTIVEERVEEKKKIYSFQEDLITNNRPRQIWNKSRQIGFSFALAQRAYIRGIKYAGFEALYTSVGQRLAMEWLDKIRAFLLLDRLEPVINKQTEIRLANGSRFISLPQNPATVRSYSPDEVYLDEFAHYKSDKKMLTALAPSLSRRDKQRVLIVGSTPFGKLGEFFRLWDAQNDYYKKQVDIYEAIKEGAPLDAEECRRSLPDELAFQQEHLCMFIDDVTSFFPYELLKSGWNPELTNMSFESMAQLKNPLKAGYDPGKLQDSGVFMVFEDTGKKKIMRHMKKWLKVDYTTQLQYMFEAMDKAKITKLNVERNGVGEKLFEDLRNKFHSRVNGFTTTNALKEKIIIDLKVLFETLGIEIFYDMELTNQLHSLQRTILQSKMVRYKHPEGQHDDMVWAMAFSLMQGENQSFSVRILGE